ncbi:hypothetical protein BV22DRAFT_1048740 [Leucogyrophana mollusca]|uniref:Uncharacterized protein n=1 Tax=Leucogyrophana mollusca TaxID=85980 RepID=A0ACB8BAF2_9AGAM|nr:hypothetical protein BV22DRAFT_1048740 [Leucogyrophana mollusca]
MSSLPLSMLLQSTFATRCRPDRACTAVVLSRLGVYVIDSPMGACHGLGWAQKINYLPKPGTRLPDICSLKSDLASIINSWKRVRSETSQLVKAENRLHTMAEDHSDLQLGQLAHEGIKSKSKLESWKSKSIRRIGEVASLPRRPWGRARDRTFDAAISPSYIIIVARKAIHREEPEGNAHHRTQARGESWATPSGPYCNPEGVTSQASLIKQRIETEA